VIEKIQDQHQRHFSCWAHNYLWIRVETGYVRCAPAGNRRFQETEVIQELEQIPPEATPMEAELTDSGCWRWTTATYVLVHGQPSDGTFQAYVNTLPEWNASFSSTLIWQRTHTLLA
jgi:hypothetical protein